MSLRITHLNADSTFLLIFSPAFASNNDRGTFPGSFTILLDPWLTGSSIIYNKHFAKSTHNIPASVESVNDLPPPDLVIVSQDKPDHCHAETLKQLDPEADATILGTPAAAKKIRGWNHFYPETVQALKRFDERKEDTLHRIRIPPLSPNGCAGEVTVALIAPKLDFTGVHNAIAITYRPPSSPLSIKTGSYVNLPLTPPATPPSAGLSSTHRSFSPARRPASSKGTSRLRGISNVSSSTLNLTASMNPMASVREKTMSAIYCPHGVSYKEIEPYATSHLLSASALPLSALFHAFNEVNNPWYLGGRINDGSPSGLEIARRLFAKVWIGAHDEDKENKGFGTRRTKVKKWRSEDIRRLLEGGHDTRKRASSGTWSAKSGSGSSSNGRLAKRCGTSVITLDAGQQIEVGK